MKKTIFITMAAIALMCALVHNSASQPNAIWNSGFGFTNEINGYVVSSLDYTGLLTLASTNVATNVVGPSGYTNTVSGVVVGSRDNAGNIAMGSAALTLTGTTSTNLVSSTGITNTVSGFVKFSVSGTGLLTASNTIVSSNGFANYGVFSNMLSGFTAWTNTNTFDVAVTFTNGVTNLCYSNSFGAMWRNTTNAGIYTQHMKPGTVITNASTSAVLWQE